MTTENKTIDMTPTWQAVLPILITALEDGTAEGKRRARIELGRMAEAADGGIEIQNKSKQFGEEFLLLMPSIRTLRLWHWQQSLKLSKWARGHENAHPLFKGPKRESLAKTFRGESNFHMKQVQLLNSFFEIGDTAEQDATKAHIEPKE